MDGRVDAGTVRGGGDARGVTGGVRTVGSGFVGGLAVVSGVSSVLGLFGMGSRSLGPCLLELVVVIVVPLGRVGVPSSCRWGSSSKLDSGRGWGSCHL